MKVMVVHYSFFFFFTSFAIDNKGLNIHQGYITCYNMFVLKEII